jgi:hypothetical protein
MTAFEPSQRPFTTRIGSARTSPTSCRRRHWLAGTRSGGSGMVGRESRLRSQRSAIADCQLFPSMSVMLRRSEDDCNGRHAGGAYESVTGQPPTSAHAAIRAACVNAAYQRFNVSPKLGVPLDGLPLPALGTSLSTPPAGTPKTERSPRRRGRHRHGEGAVPDLRFRSPRKTGSVREPCSTVDLGVLIRRDRRAPGDVCPAAGLRTPLRSTGKGLVKDRPLG